MNIQFQYEHHEYLAHAAVMRGLSEEALVRKLMSVIAEDKMVDAILDDVPEGAHVPEPKTKSGYAQYMKRSEREKLILRDVEECEKLGLRWCIQRMAPTQAEQARWQDALAALRSAGKLIALPRENRGPIYYELCPVPTTEAPSSLSSGAEDTGPSTEQSPSHVEGPAPTYLALAHRPVAIASPSMSLGEKTVVG